MTNVKKNIFLRKEVSLVSKIISQLMSEIGIKEAELARQTGLPQTTINRLLLGDTIDPRSNTLKPIAKYFGVTIGQILGEETINPERISGTFNPFNRDAWTPIPIISWDEIIAWVFRHENYTLHQHANWITTERPVSKNSFAIMAMPFMEPRFRKDSILIVDPEIEPRDNQFAVITLDNQHVTVRQLTFDNAWIYLRHFDVTIPTLRLDKAQHRILGIIVEARIDLNKN